MAKKQEQPDNLHMLKQAIRAKAPGRLYFFYGEEVFLLHHYLEQLRKVTIDELTESFNYHKLTSETFDLREFADCVENLPMMAECTFVQVDDVDELQRRNHDGLEGNQHRRNDKGMRTPGNGRLAAVQYVSRH